MLGIIPILMLTNIIQITIVGKSADADEERKTGQLVGEVVAGFRTVASFTAEQRFVQRFNAGVDAGCARRKKAAVTAGLMEGISAALLHPLVGVLLYYGAWLMSVGAIHIGGGDSPDQTCDSAQNAAVEKIFVPIMVMAFMAQSLGQIASLATDGDAASKAATELFKIIDRKAEPDVRAEGGQTIPDVKGELEVRNVVFAYPTRPNHVICNGYDLHIPAGTTCALCGPSGSGKSTIIQLLERFYDPDSGAVALDGVDLKDLNLRWLRQQIGLVGQEPILFIGTVAENIRYGKPDATQEEVEKAALLSNAHEFVTTKLSEGYHTDVGSGGGKLSGGQKQVLCRVVYRVVYSVQCSVQGGVQCAV